MKMFVARSYVNAVVAVYCIAAFALIGFLVLIEPWRASRYVVCGGIVLLLALLTVRTIRWINGMGLYISEDVIHYQAFKRRIIKANDIVGVIIVKSIWFGGYLKQDIDIKDRQGNQLYTAIFINEIKNEMMTYARGDIHFNSDFKKQVIFDTVYNKELIDYFKIINPNMLIIDHYNVSGRNEVILPKDPIPSIKSNDAQEIALYYTNLTREQCSPMETNWFDGGERNRQWIITFTDDKGIYHHMRINADTGEVIQDSPSVYK